MEIPFLLAIFLALSFTFLSRDRLIRVGVLKSLGRDIVWFVLIVCLLLGIGSNGFHYFHLVVLIRYEHLYA